MGKRGQRRGRTTPKGTRPGHLRPVSGNSDDSPIDNLIDMGGQELLGEADALGAETWASNLMAMFDSFRMEAQLARQEVPPFEEAVIERCEARADRQSMATLAALAAVVPPPLDRMARRAVDRLRLSRPVPEWFDELGRTEPARAWIAGDVFGDQESLIVGFSQAGATHDHAIVALVDNNLSGQAKDAFLAGDLDKVVTAWKSNDDPHLLLEEAPIGLVLARLRDAMAISDLWNGDTELRTEEFAEHRALVWSRLRRAGLGPETHRDLPEVTQTVRDELVAEFLASPFGRQAATQVAAQTVEVLAHHLVRLRADYEGRPLRWSPQVAEMVLIDLAPRKLLLSPGEAAALPPVLRAFVRYAAERNGLEPVFLDEILTAIDRAGPSFLERMRDPAAAGPAKALLAGLQARGVDLAEPEQIVAALDELGPISLGRPAPRVRHKRPDAPAVVRESVAAAPVLARLDVLTGFFGDGRKLTQTGQPTLADARILVSRLRTGDRFDETIGDRTFKTTSAAELPELGFMIRWAVAAGALRKQHGKLLATAGWERLASKPVERWVRAADALPKMGPLEGFFTHARYRSRGEVLDELASELLDALSEAPMQFDAALDLICDEADLRFEWLARYMQEPDSRRRSFGHDLDLLLRILGWAGIAQRIGPSAEPDRWERSPERLVGGEIELTTAGRWWLGADQHA